MRILLTNDDGRDSPFLPFTIRSIQSTFGRILAQPAFSNVHSLDLNVVIPRDEQSWKAKAMTRFDALVCESAKIDGVETFFLSGTPADCANFGVHKLPGGKPDLLISGINIGENSGLAFTLSSGTVGACFEANIVGLPAIAFSQGLNTENMIAYRSTKALSQEASRMLEAQCVRVVNKVLTVFGENPHLLSDALTWSVNIPFSLKYKNEADKESFYVKICSLGNSFYGDCFRKIGSSYKHEVKGLGIDYTPETDWRMLEHGYVTITPIDIRVLGKISQDKRVEFQRYFES